MFQQRSNMDNPFMMFEMLTRAVFDKFFNDDFFWHQFDFADHQRPQDIHFPNLNPQSSSRSTSSRLRSASQQRVPTSSTNRTRIHVNHVPTSKQPNEMHFEWLGQQSRQKRATSTSRFESKDSDEENLDDQYVFQQRRPPTIHVQRLRRRTMNNNTNNEPKIPSCQFCFQPIPAMDARLQHEAVCRHRPNKSTSHYRTKSYSQAPQPPPPPPTTTNATSNENKSLSTKCLYCHQEVRLTDRLDHEALCKQFGMKRQSTSSSSSKRFTPSMSNNFNGDSQTPPKTSSGNDMNEPRKTSTAN